MSRRDSEPSERVSAILEEGRERDRVLQVPSSLAGGRYGVSRRAVVGALVVVVVAVLVLGGRFLLAQQQASPQPVDTSGEGEESPFAPEPGGDPSAGAQSPAGAGAAQPAAAGGDAASPAPSGRVTVHVAGEVETPGVVTLPAGARVDDALEEAGGTSGEADLASINLARPLVDGEQVYVPAPGEVPPAAGAAPGGSENPGGGSASGEGETKVNLNTADQAELETLSGVGPVLAERILDWRTEHDRFSTIDELGEVSGIGEKTFAQLAPKVTV